MHEGLELWIERRTAERTKGKSEMGALITLVEGLGAGSLAHSIPAITDQQK